MKMNINSIIEKYIIEELVLPDGKRVIDPDESLISTGVIDSLAIMRLIAFVEERFDVLVEDEEVIPTNFETINTIRTLVENKLN
jgi:acyl carrier protein